MKSARIASARGHVALGLAAALAGVAVVGCAASARPLAVVAHVAPRPPAPRHARLYYEIDQHPVGSPPVPIVHATVAGVATNLLIETGSSPHVLAGWLARRAHLTLSAPMGSERDNAGRTSSTRVAEHADVRIDGWGSIGAGPVVVAEVPDAFEALNIGGLISPQMLVQPPAALRLDLHQGEMLEVDFAVEYERLSHLPGALVTSWARGCTLGQALVPNTRFTVPVTIGGHDAELTISTGTDRSFLLSNRPSIAPLLDQTQPNPQSTMGLGGEIEIRGLPAVDFHVGELGGTGSFNVDMVHGAGEAACPHDGNLGIDLLSHCVLLINALQFTGRCAL